MRLAEQLWHPETFYGYAGHADRGCRQGGESVANGKGSGPEIIAGDPLYGIPDLARLWCQQGLDPPQRDNLLEPMTSEERKLYPVKKGFLDYFRDAVFRVARVSYEGNQKHNPGEPTHWARGKSDDHGDCLARHMMCDDDEEHLANAAWRAMAQLQLYLERKYNIKPPPGVRIYSGV